MNILISDKTSPLCAQILREAGHQVDEKPGLSHEELKAIIGNYDGLIVRSATKVTADIIEAASKLKVIGRAGSGVDNIDLQAAEQRGVVVMNTPGGNTNAVAELALGFMFALSRQLVPATGSLKAKKWEKKKFQGMELKGKKVGFIGYGRVSRTCGQKCLALGMQVQYFDPKIRKNLVDLDGLELRAELREVLDRADFVSVHLTKKPETVHFIGAEEFELMKDGVYFINCSRGGIVDEDALFRALESGKVAGAALDVYAKEPPTDFRLIEHPRVICTPHIGASTREAQENVAVQIAQQFVDMFAGKEIRNAVTRIPGQ